MYVVISSKSSVLCQRLRTYERESGRKVVLVFYPIYCGYSSFLCIWQIKPAYTELRPSRVNAFLIRNKNGSICKGEGKDEII